MFGVQADRKLFKSLTTTWVSQRIELSRGFLGNKKTSKKNKFQ
jgi:hypothetical protein